MAKTTVPPSVPNEQSTRRSLIGLFTAGGALVAAPAVLAADLPTKGGATTVPPLSVVGDIDPHLAWEQEMWQLAALWCHCNPEWMALDEAKTQAVMDRFDALQRWVFSQPPQTLGGAAAVIRAAVFVQRQFDSELTDDQLTALQRTATIIDRLAAGRPWP